MKRNRPASSSAPYTRPGRIPHGVGQVRVDHRPVGDLPIPQTRLDPAPGPAAHHRLPQSGVEALCPCDRHPPAEYAGTAASAPPSRAPARRSPSSLAWLENRPSSPEPSGPGATRRRYSCGRLFSVAVIGSNRTLAGPSLQVCSWAVQRPAQQGHVPAGLGRRPCLLLYPRIAVHAGVDQHDGPTPTAQRHVRSHDDLLPPRRPTGDRIGRSPPRRRPGH